VAIHTDGASALCRAKSGGLAPKIRLVCRRLGVPDGRSRTVGSDGIVGSEPSHPGFSVNIVNLGGFGVLTAWGLGLRKNPAAHKRIMMLAMVVFADPGFSRLTDFLVTGPRSVLTWFVYTFYGNFALLALMAFWDWRHGRMMRQFVIGSAGVVVAYVAAWGLYFWEPWRALTLGWVQTWAKIFAN
jgi:hypothetical protein